MTTIRHCRHCWGNCDGDCLLGDTGMCIHNIRIRQAWQGRGRVGGRAWWRQVFWGVEWQRRPARGVRNRGARDRMFWGDD